jgi:acyl carrier protein
MKNSIEADVRKFIAENFLFRDNADSLSGSDSLLESGVIDSTGVMELVWFLEERFGLEVSDSEVAPGNFDTIDGLVAFVSEKTKVLSGGLAS